MRFKEYEDHWLDTETGIRWSLTTIGPMSWEEAMKPLPGYKLPSIDQLSSLVISFTNPMSKLPDMYPDIYWSGTERRFLDDIAIWVFDFSTIGGESVSMKDDGESYVRYIKEE